MAQKILGNKISYTNEPFEMLDKIDALIICTEWDEFKNINVQKLQTKLKSKTIFDGRNIFDPKIMSPLRDLNIYQLADKLNE